MSTSSRIKFINGKEILGAAYFSIDGHVWRFAPKLVAALKATTPQDILKNQKLIELIGEGGLYGEDDDYLDYLCEVDISQDNYVIKLYEYKNILDFQGSLDEFAEKYIKSD